MTPEDQSELRRMREELAQLKKDRDGYWLPSAKEIPLGYVRCAGCGKIIKDGRWLGTLHLCSE